MLGPRLRGDERTESPSAHFHASGNPGPLSPRMSVLVGLQQMRAVDLRIALRGREARMPQQLLDRAQVRAGTQQMGRKGMAQRVRRRGVREAERDACSCHAKLDDARAKLLTARADEQRIVRAELRRAELQVCLLYTSPSPRDRTR